MGNEIKLDEADLVGKTIDSVEWVSGGSDSDEDDYLVVRVGDVTLYASAPTAYRQEGFQPTEDYREAWERFQRGEEITPAEMRELDDQRTTWALEQGES